jgi:hypothetical protein
VERAQSVAKGLIESAPGVKCTECLANKTGSVLLNWKSSEWGEIWETGFNYAAAAQFLQTSRRNNGFFIFVLVKKEKKKKITHR